MPDEPLKKDVWKAEAASTVICGLAIATGWGLRLGGLQTASMATLMLAYAAGGWDTLRRTTGALRRREIDVDLLMLVAAIGAATVGHWLEGSILLFLFSTGNTLETYAFGRTRRSIQGLMELRPEEASVLQDGKESPVAVVDLEPGQIVRVRPGERIPVDGTVSAGASRVDESTLTGEPTPVAKEAGMDLFAGTLNGTGALDVLITRRVNDTALARVVRLVEEARDAKAPTQSWIEEVEGRYALGVIVASAVAVLFFWLGLRWDFHDAFYRAMTLLVVASPCALVISIPATIVSAVSNGAHHGVLFKGGAHLDALASVKVAALDKTGTITIGRPAVVGVLSLLDSPELVAASSGTVAVADDPDSVRGIAAERDLIRLVASVEALSEHPLGTAVIRAAEERSLDLLTVEGFEAFSGRGVAGTVGGVHVRVGRRRWIEHCVGVPLPPEANVWAEAGRQRAATPVFVAMDGRHAGAIAIADQPRPGVRAALEALRASGVTNLVMLTGDDAATARAIADEVGLDEVHAELFPEEKSRVLDDLRARFGPVAMVGDGVNDAPALAAADVGIALGAAGTDVALETADLVVMGEQLDGLAHAVDLSHRARRIVRQNLIFATSVMFGLVVLALTGRIGLTMGVVGHEGSTVIVVFNGLRLLRHEKA